MNQELKVTGDGWGVTNHFGGARVCDPQRKQLLASVQVADSCHLAIGMLRVIDPRPGDAIGTRRTLLIPHPPTIFGARAVAGLEQPPNHLPKRRDRRAPNPHLCPSAIA